MMKLNDWASIAITVKLGAGGESAWQRKGLFYSSMYDQNSPGE
jgi:hypothetical protein